ncbi:RpiB/LacA/LacB family sugar-phosphate isomerase [Candidatus Uhrbacteria bacterium]|nr:RpiB/LacA/LacB family sugar-phosphate isomerase [Candidatus Uhrbacteria bacterium]
MKSTLYIAADHRGFAMKKYILSFLAKEKIICHDLGAYEYDKNDDYPDMAQTLAKKVATSPNNKGILLCGSGQGVCIAANKVKEVRAALSWNIKSARNAKIDGNANVLCLSADWLSKQEIRKIVHVWLSTPFLKEARHLRRLKKISQIK